MISNKKKPHRINKNNCTCVIRCILLNIHDRFETNYEYYNISYQEYEAYILALVNNNMIKKIKNNPKTTLDYIVCDPIKYNEWSRTNLYKKIEKYVLPLLQIGIGIIASA